MPDRRAAAIAAISGIKGELAIPESGLLRRRVVHVAHAGYTTPLSSIIPVNNFIVRECAIRDARKRIILEKTPASAIRGDIVTDCAMIDGRAASSQGKARALVARVPGNGAVRDLCAVRRQKGAQLAH